MDTSDQPWYYIASKVGNLRLLCWRVKGSWSQQQGGGISIFIYLWEFFFSVCHRDIVCHLISSSQRNVNIAAPWDDIESSEKIAQLWVLIGLFQMSNGGINLF